MYNLKCYSSGFYKIRLYLFNSDDWLITDYSSFVRYVELWKSQNYVSDISIKQINRLGYCVVKVLYTYDFYDKFGLSSDVIAYINPNRWR